jgi:glutamate carboxypeptidase
MLRRFVICWSISALSLLPGTAHGGQGPSSAGPAADSLTAVERAIAARVDTRREQAVELLERIVNINSGTMNRAGVTRVGAILRAELDQLGFTTRWEDGAPFQRAGHLIATHAGTGPRLLLIGHLDTVFEPESPFQRFERQTPTTARGPGVIDMKGGDVIIVEALRALKAAGVLEGMNVTVIMHGDEERPGEPLALARRSLIEAAKQADVAIGFEDGSGDPTKAVIARRGFTAWRLEVTGTAAHSSQIFTSSVGAGAIFETARILRGFEERLSHQQYLTLSPGVAAGGTAVIFDSTGARATVSGKSNIVAATMTVTGDLRTLSAEQLAGAKRTMEEIVAAASPHTSATIRFDDGYPPMAPVAGNLTLLDRYSRISRSLGFGPVSATDPSAAGAADVSFTAPCVPMAIDGIGLAGHDDHTPNETADLATLPMLTKRAAILFYRLSRSERPRP